MYLQVYNIWEATARATIIGATKMRNNYGAIQLTIFLNFTIAPYKVIALIFFI